MIEQTHATQGMPVFTPTEIEAACSSLERLSLDPEVRAHDARMPSREGERIFSVCERMFSEVGQEANKSVFEYVDSFLKDKELVPFFTKPFKYVDSIGEKALPSAQNEELLSVITVHYLIMERYVYEQMHEHTAVGVELNLFREALIAQGLSFVPPTKNFASIATFIPIPLLPAKAPLSVVALEYQLQRILEQFCKNRGAAQIALQNVIKKIARLHRHPNKPQFLDELTSISKFVQISISDYENQLRFSVPSKVFAAFRQELIKKNLLIPLLGFFNHTQKEYSKECESLMIGALFPLDEEFVSRNFTPFQRRVIDSLKILHSISKKIIADYLSIQSERTAEYARAIRSLKATDSFERFFNSEGARWKRKIIPISKFGAKFETFPSFSFMIDQELASKAALSTFSDFLPAELRKKLVKQLVQKKTEHHVQKKIQPKQERKKEKVFQEIEIKDKGKAPETALVDVLAAPSATATVALPKASFPKDPEYLQPVKKKTIPQWQYHWHVRRWFDPKYNPFIEDPDYAKKNFSPEVRRMIRIEHAFAPLMHHYVIERGKCFVEERADRPRRRFTMLGEMYNEQGFSRKGVFTISVGGDGFIYHAFFTKKTSDELSVEYREKGFFESKEEGLVVRDGGGFSLQDDGSVVVQDDGDLVVIRDKVNNLFLAVYRLNDPFEKTK